MELKDKIRVIMDFPTKGISFKDISTVLQDKEALKEAIDGMCALVDEPVDLVVGPEARGFIFGTAIAYNLGVGFVLARKPGKLPYETVSKSYDLEYGSDSIEIHIDAIKKGDRVVIVDDLIATGGTLKTTAELVEEMGGKVVKCISLIELTGLGGREKLKAYHPASLVQYEF